MISPITVLNHCIDLLKDIQAELGATDIFSADEDSTEAAAPYIFGYCDFTDEAELHASGYAGKIPVNINFQCVSSEKQSSDESFDEVFLMAAQIMNTITETYFLTNTNGLEEPCEIKSNRLPLVILNKSAMRSVIQVRFQYDIPTVYS